MPNPKSRDSTLTNFTCPHGIFLGLQRTLQQYRFGLAAFLIPLGIRSIPEIIVGQYPIGWDTIAFYVPNTLDWAAGKASLLQMLGTAPLMYMISVSVYLFLRVNPVWIFKVMGPLLYGSMIWALFRFVRLGLRWPEKQALGGALMTSLYFVTLRISWDMYRNMLGLTFILFSLPLLEDWKGPRKQVLLSALIVLAVASDQLTAVIALFLVGARSLTGLMRRDWDELTGLVRIAMPGVLLFFSIVYAGQIVSGIGMVQKQAPTPTLDSLASSLGFLGYSYLALAPLIIAGLRRVPSHDLKNWSVLCAGAVFTALLPFFGLVVMSYRWSLLLSIPLCVYAAAGLSSLTGSRYTILRLTRLFNKAGLPIFATLLVGFAVLYIGLPAQSAFPYYTAFPALLPTSMVQDTVPLSDMDSLIGLMHWVASNSNSQTALITHQAIYGWARAYFPASDRIVNYEYASPLVGVEKARLEGYSSMLMIWWVDGLGWHGQPDVPDSFTPLLRSGDLAVYIHY